MDIDEMKIGQAKELSGLLRGGHGPGPWRVGEKYLIRTVTNYLTGKMSAVYENELVLEDAAWIADTGRFSDALSKGEFSEVEPIDGPCIIGRGAVVDAELWNHELPKDQK